mgnify:CR=1 FL=1
MYKYRLFIIVLFTMIFSTVLYFSNSFNFQNRIKYNSFQLIKLIDEHIFKSANFISEKDSTSLLIIGHAYGNYDKGVKKGKQIHPDVETFITKRSVDGSVDHLVLLGDIVEKASWGNILSAKRQIQSLNVTLWCDKPHQCDHMCSCQPDMLQANLHEILVGR